MTRTSKSNAILVLALWGAGLGAAAQFGKISVIYDLLGGVYAGAGGAAIGLMVSVVGLVGLVFGTTAGLLVQGLGYRRVMVGALVLAAALSAVQAIGLPYPLMMATRVIEGLSHLVIVVVGPTLIAQTASARFQGLAMTLWSSFFGVSFALMAWLGLPFVSAHGVAALFLAHAAYMAVFAAILWRLMPRDAPSRGLPSLSLRGLIAQHGAIYRSASVAAPALGFLNYTILYVALLTLLPPLIGAPHQVMVATAMPLVSIAVSLSLGVWLLRHVSAVKMVQAGFFVTAASALVLWGAWGHDTVVVTAALVMAGALGLIQGASFAAIPQLNVAPENQARAAGAMAQLGNLGTTSGTPILALFIAGGGTSGILVFVLPFCVIGIVLHTWLTRRRKAEGTAA